MALSFSSKTYLAKPLPKSLSRLFPLRSRSNSPSPSNHSDFSDDSPSTESMLRQLEDAIHRIIVRRAAPGWPPFLPGSSYWVPPPRSTAGSLGIAHLVQKLAHPLPDGESLSRSTLRGWPSSDYFIKGASPHMIEPKMTAKKSEAEASSNKSKTAAPSSNMSKSEDEEG